MKLWAKAQKTLITGETRMLNSLKQSTLQFIVLTETCIIIHVNIRQYTTIYTVFFIRFKKKNDPIVIEYDPGKFQKLYYGNSALLNKLKYYPPYYLLLFYFLP
jgi:hypothetical protein